MSHVRSFVVTVVVAGNTGSGTFNFPSISGLRIKTIAIDAPNGAAYDWVLRDGEAYAMTGEVGASGDETYAVNLPMAGVGSVATGVITMVNATDGSYNVKIWAEYN